MAFADVMRVIRSEYIYKDTIDWDFLSTLVAFVPANERIDFVVAFLRNPHTTITTASDRAALAIRPPTVMRRGNNITIKYFDQPFGAPEARRDYVNGLIAQITQQSRYDDITIDLRNNGGGDGQCMLLSLLPIFMPKRIIGYFFVGGKFIPVEFKTQGNKVKFFDLVVDRPKRITAKNITVIMGKNTASAGEWMAVCLRSIGATFRGKTSGTYNSINNSMPIGNGRTLNLTVGYFADTHKRIYAGALRDTDMNQ